MQNEQEFSGDVSTLLLKFCSLTAYIIDIEGDVILFETPSYLGALNALITYEAELVVVPTDNNGMEIEALKEAFEKYGDRIKLIYVNPTIKILLVEAGQKKEEFSFGGCRSMMLRY